MSVTTATKPKVRYVCARCEKSEVPERMVYSRHTRRRYCAEFNACDKRARRKGLL